MRKFLSIAFLFLSLFTVRAADLVTATITITNSTESHDTFVVNASTRTWTNAVFNTATQILTNSTIGGTKTNLMLHIGGTGFSGVTFQDVGTNSFKLIGTTLAVSFTGDYAEVSYATNTTGVGQLLRLPFTSQGQLTNRTNNANWIIDGLNDYATSTLDTNAPALANFLNIGTGAQTITFSGATVISNASARFDGGIITNATAGFTNGTITNVFSSGGTNSTPTIVSAVSISGTASFITNGLFVGLTSSNGVNVGTAFSSPGSVSAGSEQFGEGANSVGLQSLAVGAAATASLDGATAIGASTSASGESSLAIGFGAESSGYNSVALGVDSLSSETNSTALGAGTIASHVNSTAVGTGAETTTSNQVMLGTASVSVKVNNILEVGGSISNAATTGSFTNRGTLFFDFGSNTNHANGNNVLTVAGYSHWNVSGATTYATNVGFTAEGEGSFKRVVFTGATTNYFIEESGLTDSTNRLDLGTGAASTLMLTNQPAWIEMIYRSSKWFLLSHSN